MLELSLLNGEPPQSGGHPRGRGGAPSLLRGGPGGGGMGLRGRGGGGPGGLRGLSAGLAPTRYVRYIGSFFCTSTLRLCQLDVWCE